MKSHLTTWLLSFITLFPSSFALAQNDRVQEAIVENYQSSVGIPAPSSTIGAPVFAPSECLSKEERAKEQANVQRTIDSLRAVGKLSTSAKAIKTRFSWPTKPKAGYTEPGYYTVNFNVDLDPTTNGLKDYSCGKRTYDGHNGTDIILWPFPWRSMDDGLMEVYAAAKGVIVRKQTSNFDRNCNINGSTAWNGIILRHADNSKSWYLHFKRGASFITSKLVGDSVQAGEFLGVSGSSGSSNWPHLHFEVHDSSDAVIDPFSGSCNATTPASLWQTQQAYEIPSVNRLVVKNATKEYRVCPTPEITFIKDTFNLGDTLALWAYMRDFANGTTVAVRIKNAANATTVSFSNTNNGTGFATAWQYWWWLINSTWTPGRYTWEFDLGGQTYKKTFFITGKVAAAKESLYQKRLEVTPNPASETLHVTGLNPNQPFTLRDILGSACLSGSGNASLNLAGLAKGMYVLHAVGFKPVRVVVE